MSDTGRPYRILLVEDEAADVLLAKKAFEFAGVPVRLDIARHGEEALQSLLDGESPPDVILLDLNMPVMSGPEFLGALKREPTLCLIPVVVLSSSDAETDVAEAYALHASCYVRKPRSLPGLMDFARSLVDFYLKTVRLPGRPQPLRF